MDRPRGRRSGEEVARHEGGWWSCECRLHAKTGRPKPSPMASGFEAALDAQRSVSGDGSGVGRRLGRALAAGGEEHAGAARAGAPGADREVCVKRGVNQHHPVRHRAQQVHLPSDGEQGDPVATNLPAQPVAGTPRAGQAGVPAPPNVARQRIAEAKSIRPRSLGQAAAGPRCRTVLRKNRAMVKSETAWPSFLIPDI